MTWAPTTQDRGVDEISIEWVKANHPSEQFILVDCREKNEWDTGRIEGAHFMPLSDFANASQDLDTDTPVVVYCRSGIRSMTATVFLQQKGIPAASMTGGILGWLS